MLQGFGYGKKMTEASSGTKWPAESFDHPAGQRVGCCPFGYLLSDDGSRGELEPVPTTRNAHSRMGPDMRSQRWVGTERTRDGRAIRVHIKHCAHTLDDEKEQPGLANLKTHFESIATGVQRNLYISAIFIHANRAAKTAVFDDFHARRGVCCQECQHPFPFVRWPKA